MTRTATRIAAGSCAGVLAAFALGVFASTSALAATFTVTTKADSGAGSLRAELALANAAGGTNTIDFARSANGTITLTSGELELTGSETVTITGNGAANTVIDGDALSRVFAVDSGVTLDLSGVTVENGYGDKGDGAGIEVEGSLDLSDSVVTGNVAEALGVGVANEGAGTVTIADTTVSDNDGDGGSGAGAANNGSGTLNILDSTFAGNYNDIFGGGVLADGAGAIDIVDSTFDDNSSFNGGAISTSFEGTVGPITIVDSTLASNRAGNSGGDIYNAIDATITVTGSILTSASGSSASCSAAVTDGGYDIDDGTSCGFSGGTDHNSTDPELGALASNGGPTQTMALDTGSPAIDAGQSGAACTSVNGSEDQRGFVRPDIAGTACDIGAYEFGAAAPTPTPAGSTVPVPTTGGAAGSTLASPWDLLVILVVAGLVLIMLGRPARRHRPI
jgi:hypothetical protein